MGALATRCRVAYLPSSGGLSGQAEGQYFAQTATLQGVVVGVRAAHSARLDASRVAQLLNYYSMSEIVARGSGRSAGHLTAMILGRLGRFLISAGVISLAFVAYQLWGTGILQAQAQSDLAEDFRELSEELQSPGAVPAVSPSPIPTAGAVVPAGTATPEPAPTATPRAMLPRRAVEREAGDVVGRLLIPRIGLDQFVVEGVGAEELKKGPGHYAGTPMPGLSGNVGLAGHRTTWGAPFHRIDELLPGDQITMEMPWGEAVYEVIGHVGDDGVERGHFIVDPSDVWVLDQDGGDRLTLTSCHPKYSARQRIIVTARLVTEPVQLAKPPTLDLGDLPLDLAAESLPSEAAPGATAENAAAAADPRATARAEPPVDEPSSFGVGLGGDRSAIPPAVAWATAAIALWWTTGYVSRRWRPVIPYVLAAGPLLATWFVAFSYIDQAIPSY